MAEKVIGFVTEPRFYRIGSFLLKQVAGVDRKLDEPDPTMKVLEILGLTNAQSILDMTVQRYWDDLEATGKVKEALLLLLEPVNDDLTPIADRKPEILDEALRMMTRRQAAEVLADFFAMNFGSTPQSGVSAGSTTSS